MTSQSTGKGIKCKSPAFGWQQLSKDRCQLNPPSIPPTASYSSALSVHKVEADASAQVQKWILTLSWIVDFASLSLSALSLQFLWLGEFSAWLGQHNFGSGHGWK